jgi:hypothetical protein
MQIELANGALRLARGQTLKVRNGLGSTVCVGEGTVWLTEENRPQDVVLEGGRCYRLSQRGIAVVQALGDASVSFA